MTDKAFETLKNDVRSLRHAAHAALLRVYRTAPPEA